jgi:thiamine monophosphate kinase
MRLSELGELGLLAELERRGLAQRIEHDAASSPAGSSSRRTPRRGVHFRLDWTARRARLRAAPVNLSDLAASAPSRWRCSSTLAALRETELDDVLELYAGLNEPACRSSAATPTRDGRTSRVTALGRSARVPAAPARGPATSSS